MYTYSLFKKLNTESKTGMLKSIPDIKCSVVNFFKHLKKKYTHKLSLMNTKYLNLLIIFNTKA